MVQGSRQWHEKLPFALLGYRITVRTSTGATPYLLVYGTEAVIPAEVEIPSFRFIVEVEIDDDKWVKTRLEHLSLIEEKRILLKNRTTLSKMKYCFTIIFVWDNFRSSFNSSFRSPSEEQGGCTFLEGEKGSTDSMQLESQILYRLGKMGAYVDIYQKLPNFLIDSLEINLVAGLISAGRTSEVQGTLDSLRVKATSSFELAYNTACSLIEREKYKDAEQLLLSAQRKVFPTPNKFLMIS
ncbi:hypothetical protein BC332_14429 [Capsicum chinense]|nr:hypothetical protein BC332_14429 [Capsicum chinense]